MLSGHHDRHLRRYRQIAQVLGHHGLGQAITALGLERFAAVPRKVLHRPTPATHTAPERLRLVLEELGTTFVKLGQILSTRPDLLGPDYQTELARLQDQAPTIPTITVREAVEAELGRPIAEVFPTFEDTPLAAASIGQVHAATLPDGTAVVVKVRRPGVVEQVEADLEILHNLAAAASRRWDIAAHYDLVGLTQEFALTLRAEMDYLQEGRNAERFATNFASDPLVRVPRVYWETTTSRVLTLERLRGLRIDDLAALDAAGIARPALAERAAEIVLKMVFDDGFFHADPHPGNFFVQPDGGIGLIDFGMVGTIDAGTQEELARLLVAVTGQESDRLADAFLELGVTSGSVDRRALGRDLGALLARYYGKPLADLTIGPIFEEVFAIVRRHHLHLPPNLMILMKALMMEEGLATRLDPNFRLPTILVPYAQRLMLRRYSPLRWAKRLGAASLDTLELSADLPQQLRRLSAQLEQGTFEVAVRPAGVDPLLRQIERLVNRLVLGILAAAFIIGLAVLLATYRLAGWERWAGTFFAVGFIVALTLGAYLAWSILRAGRR